MTFALRAFAAVLRLAFFAMISGILTAMTSDNASELEPTIFSAVLTPHRSLNRVGFWILIGAYGAVSFIAGVVFLLMGAWPVFGFFGLDVLLLYWAFRLNYRHAAAYEEVKVTPAALTVRKVSHRGIAREWVLNPLWVRLEKTVHEEFGIERLFLVSRGKELAVASFLGSRRESELRQGAGRGAHRGQARPDPDGARLTRNRVARRPGPS